MRFLLLIAFVLGASESFAGERSYPAVKSPFLSCKQRKLVERPSFDWVPGLAAACPSGAEVVPSVGVFEGIREVREWHRYCEFSVLVGERIREYLKKNGEGMSGLASCLSQLSDWDASKNSPCADDAAFIREKILPWVPVQRQDIAVAFDPMTASSMMTHLSNFNKDTDRLFNRALRVPGTWPSPVKMEPLSEDEARTARAILDEKVRDVNARFKEVNLKQELELSKFRNKYQKHLLALWSDYPVLAMLPSRNPTPKDFAQALRQMVQNGAKVKLRIGKQIAEIQKDGPDTLDHMIELNAYYAAVEEVLQDHPEFCSTATSFFNFSENRETQKAIVSGGGLLLAGFLVPAVVSVPLFVGTSAVWISDSQKTFQRTLENALSSAVPDSPISGMEDAAVTGDELRENWLLSPLSLVGLPVLKSARFLKGVGSKGLRQTRRMFD